MPILPNQKRKIEMKQKEKKKQEKKENERLNSQRHSPLPLVGNSRLNFLKMITPRQRGVADKGKFVYEDGKWVQKELNKPEKNSTVQNPNIGEMLKRHNELVARQRRVGM